MKNKKRNYTILAILLAVVALGIGYATATTLLTINGSATALASDGAELEMSNASVSGGQSGSSATVDSNDSSVGTCTVVLKTAGETATCTFTVSRASGMDAGVDVSSITASVYTTGQNPVLWENSNDEWFDITASVTDASLSDGDTTTLTVEVELLKANLTGSDVTETFTVKVDGEATNA